VSPHNTITAKNLFLYAGKVTRSPQTKTRPSSDTAVVGDSSAHHVAHPTNTHTQLANDTSFKIVHIGDLLTYLLHGAKSFLIIFNVAPCVLPHLLYNPTHALFTL